MPPCDWNWFAWNPIDNEVSILVLVDAALRLHSSPILCASKSVSILVLVDAALRLLMSSGWSGQYRCFNPCFNGCRPATMLNASFYYDEFSFNPCFNGCRPATRPITRAIRRIYSFNPCFNGCRPATSRKQRRIMSCGTVSILVLMDAALRQY